MMLAWSRSTPSRSHVTLKLLTNYLQRSDHDRTDPVGSSINQVLAEDDRKIDM
jgi:hypothetical protein